MFAAVLAFALPATGHAAANWRLLYAEDFAKPIDSGATPWVRDGQESTSPWRAGPLDDAGRFFEINGGDAFRAQLKTFELYRKRLAFGADGWLTVELAARGPAGRGEPEAPPSFKNGRIEEPDHRGGVLLRNTRPLPPAYRIEVELADLNFGGSRAGKWDGNGYSLAGAKPLHPWTWGPDASVAKPAAEWADVRGANGFYLLAIVDYPDPAPHNNVFIHTHRKVVMDVYNVPEGGFEACDPETRTFYAGGDNTVDAFFAIPGTKLESRAVMKTECGTIYGGKDGRSNYVAAAQLLPGERYRFAIERSTWAYTLEMSGRFKSGKNVFRYARSFGEDGVPIWHYNQSAAEYDGRFDEAWRYEGPHGRFESRSWPKGSAYPDSFILGDPHLNFYEGSASVSTIRLYVPK